MKLINYLFIFIFLSFTPSFSENPTGFNAWKESFKKTALENDISEETFDIVMADIKFLPDVIKYDRYQPEFYEDTKTYISKRASSKKVSNGIDFL
jgi:membrane-bound lytic murein transglycosylase B